MKTGRLQVYTGDGKGKTTAALGLSLRAAGAGLKVYIAQLMKKGGTSELKSLSHLREWITIEQFGTGRFVGSTPSPEDSRMAKKGVEAALSAMTSGRYDLVVLDEGCVAAAKGVISQDRLLELAASRPPEVELVITGRGADPRLTDTADLVTHMTAVKHYYEAGTGAREGIER
jgi:cob(I)alamin adenosyltransferase